MDQILSPATVRTVTGPLTRTEAIDLVGSLLVETGAVAPEYVSSMHEREASVSTYMGNLLAIPHGTDAGKALINRSALAVVRVDTPIDWGGNPVRFVIGIAGIGNEHLGLLSNIAIVFSDTTAVDELADAPSAAAIFDRLASVNS